MTFPFSGSQRPFALVGLSLAVLPLATITATVTRLHRHHLSTVAQDWSARGEAAHRAGRAGEAVEDFLSALMYAREDRALRLRLGRALMAAGRGAEARGYLLTLWEDEPGNGPVNLELARIAARQGHVADATRYYHAAIEGAWDADAERRRFESRLELAEYLVSVGETARAGPELVALSADMPVDPVVKKAIAALLARAGQRALAQSVYEHVLARSPDDPVALSGAGEAAFHAADYAKAARYLTRAIARGEQSPDVARDRSLAQLVLDIDPAARRLGVTARATRAIRAFDAARTRLATCEALRRDSNELTTLTTEAATIAPLATEPSLVRNPDRIEILMDSVFDIEIATARICGDATGLDRALHLIALARKSER